MNDVDRESIARLAAASVARRTGKLRDLLDLEQEARLAIHKAELAYNPALSELAPHLWICARNACIDWIRSTYGRYTRKTAEAIGDRDFGYEDHALALIEQQDSARRAQELLDGYKAEEEQKRAERVRERREKLKIPPKPPIQPLTAGPYAYGLLSYERLNASLIVRHHGGWTLVIPIAELRYVLDLMELEIKKGPQERPETPNAMGNAPPQGPD